MSALREWFEQILTDDDVREYLSSFEPKECLDFDEQTRTILQLMAGVGGVGEAMPPAPGCEDLVFDAVYDSDMALSGWTVGLSTRSLGRKNGWACLYVTAYDDWDTLTTDQSAEGLAQAWATVEGAAESVRLAQEFIDRANRVGGDR